MRQKWSKEIIIETIRNLYERGEKLCPIRKINLRLYCACFKHFGGWRQTVEAAGLDYEKISSQKPHRKWNKESVILEIQERKRKGLPINFKAISIQDSGLKEATYVYFGSWRKALKIAGFCPRELNPRRVWTKESVLLEIRKLWQANQSLNYRSIQKPYSSLLHAANKIFGSWNNALGAAGLDYERIRLLKHNYWDKEKILLEIRNLEKRRISLNSHVIFKLKHGLFEAAVKNFGSWSQAVKAAGLDYSQYRKYKWSYRVWLRNLSSAQLQELDDRVVQLAKVRRGTQ